jgi:hypothetical protein
LKRDTSIEQRKAITGASKLKIKNNKYKVS